MPEFFSNKKFQSSTPNKLFKSAYEYCEKTYKDKIPRGSFISGELMGIQNHAYTKSDGVYIVLHGSIIVETTNFNCLNCSDLELLCESFKTEGYVIVENLGPRFKLKREYFPDINNVQKQRGKFIEPPNQYTDLGLKLCMNGNFGYYHATINDITEPSIIAENNGFKLLALPHNQAISKQLSNNFDGEKMLGLIETVGSGDTYRYTKKIIGKITEKSEFQLKFDGETVLLHKDELCQNFHLMVKFQVNVHEIKQQDGNFKYRLGWV
jgi:hypothetical protein